MKYYKILVNLKVWHLRPYKMKGQKIQDSTVDEYGFLCFKLIIND